MHTRRTTKSKKRSNKKRQRTTRFRLWPLFRSKYLLLGMAIVLIIPITLFFFRPETPPPPDDRPSRIDAYFAKYNLPLTGYGAAFVEAADLCGMDWRLLPAIAMRESTGGKRMQYNNPFGWGGAQIPFADLHEAIVEVGAHLCGMRDTTATWYATTSTYEKLYRYNGTVIATYPAEVAWIMDQF